MRKLSLVDNAQYVYPQNHVTDVHKAKLLTGEIGLPVAGRLTGYLRWSPRSVGPLYLPAGRARGRDLRARYSSGFDQLLANMEAR